MDRKDIRAERNTDWHWEVSVSASIPTTPHHSQCFPPIRLLKKKWLQSYWWVGPLWHRRNPHGAGPLFGLWSVFGKGQSAPAMTWFLLRKEILLSILFFSPPHDSRQGVLWSPVDFFFLLFSFIFSLCACMKGGGSTLPLQLLMIMSS